MSIYRRYINLKQVLRLKILFKSVWEDMYVPSFRQISMDFGPSILRIVGWIEMVFDMKVIVTDTGRSLKLRIHKDFR